MSLINQNKYNMKKLLRLFPLLLLCACVLTSCDSDDDGDGDSISNPAENEYVINGHKFIDLGLPSGLLWADCNVGAASPEDSGYYYAWGETEPKQDGDYSWEKYKFNENNRVSKYNTFDAKVTLEAMDDVATMKWGKVCHIPTVTEIMELKNNCNWTWADSKGGGYVVTGPNGKSIFLPAAGAHCARSTLSSSEFDYKGIRGHYWSSSLYSDSYSYAAQPLYFWDDVSLICVGGGNFRFWGYSIRPVARI